MLENQGKEIANLSSSVSTLLHKIADLKTHLSFMTASVPVTSHHLIEDKPLKCSYAQAVVPTDQTPSPGYLRKTFLTQRGNLISSSMASKNLLRNCISNASALRLRVH